MGVRAIALGVLVVAMAGPAIADDAGTQWYVLVTDGGLTIGSASETIADTPGGRIVIDKQEVTVEQDGEPSPMVPWFTIHDITRMTATTVRIEDAAGRATSIVASSALGDDWLRNEARIAGGTATITHATKAETRTATVALPPGTRFDDGDGLLAHWDGRAPLDFANLSVDAMAVERVTITATGPADTQGRIAALRKRYVNGALAGIARLVVDKDGRVAQIAQPMFGAAQMTLKRTDEKTARADHPAYRSLATAMVKSPYRIPSSALTGHIRYRFGFRDAIVFEIPQTGEQRVSTADGIATVDICADCGPGLADDPATLADALRPTAWLQSDAPEIKDIVAPVLKERLDETARMALLARKARPYLGRLDFNGHFSALETLHRHAGDCTEAAVLLAALGRAAGIPTRVANGLVYSREEYHGVSNTWMPHSWVLAYTGGRWRSFDAALNTFDTTHIALTVGDGDAQSVSAASALAGLLTWNGMAEVRARTTASR